TALIYRLSLHDALPIYPRSDATTRPRSAPTPISNRPRKMELRECAGIDSGDCSEELQGVLFFALEGVAADDRSKASAIPNGPDRSEEHTSELQSRFDLV